MEKIHYEAICHPPQKKPDLPPFPFQLQVIAPGARLLRKVLWKHAFAACRHPANAVGGVARSAAAAPEKRAALVAGARGYLRPAETAAGSHRHSHGVVEEVDTWALAVGTAVFALASLGAVLFLALAERAAALAQRAVRDTLAAEPVLGELRIAIPPEGGLIFFGCADGGPAIR